MRELFPYPLKSLTDSCLLFKLHLHHFLLFAGELHLLFDALFLLQLLQDQKEIKCIPELSLAAQNADCGVCTLPPVTPVQ